MKKMWAALATGLLIMGFTGSATAALVQWTTAAGGNGHWYEMVTSANGIDFNDAKSAAEAAGGYLATPDLSGEAAFIYNNLTAPAANGQLHIYWLGAYSLGSIDSYKWQWVSGGYITAWSNQTYFDWSVNGNVNDYSGAQGLCQIPNNSWTQGVNLQDYPSMYTQSGYVIEFNQSPAVPLPAGIWLFGTGLAGLFGLKRRCGRMVL